MASDPSDCVDDSLVVIMGASAPSQAVTETEREARLVVDACSAYFTELSLHMKKLLTELPAGMKPWFPQIAGGALQAQLLVLIEDLKKNEDLFGVELILEFGQQIAARVTDVLSQKRL